MSLPVCPQRNSSLPLVCSSELQVPQKKSSSPAVVSAISPQFQMLYNNFFKVCGANYGNGEIGQPAIEAAWERLRECAVKQCCMHLLPKKPINVKMSDEGLSYIDYFRRSSIW